MELHAATALERTEFVTVPSGRFGNRADQIDVVNLTAGLHFEFARCTALRVAGVFPLRDGDNRFFDSELIVTLNRRF